MASAAELMTAPRGTDPRLAPNARRTTSERREKYYERMDAKAAIRAEQDLKRRVTVEEDFDGDGA
jgi:GTP-binding protein